MTARRSTSLTLLVVALVAVLAAPASAAGAFWDDDGAVHEPNIEGLAARGVTLGCDPPARSQYCPNDTVLRGQMAAFLARALALPAAEDDHFVDDDGSIFEDAINRIAERGITTGCNPPDNDRYCPDEPVLRGQMAKFLSRGYGVPTSEDDAFRDDEDSVFEAAINGIEDASITVGCNPPDNDRYCPDEPVLRGQMATFLVRADDDLRSLEPSRLHERVLTYTVGRSSPAISADQVALLSRRTAEASYATDGWNIRHRLLLDEVGDGARFHVELATPDDVEAAAPACSRRYSCTVGDRILINIDEFLDRPDTWQDRSQAEYQRYVILHELGHFLDFDGTADQDDPSHYNDDRYCVDGAAPVMKQQTIDTGDCTTNVYPLPFERDCVEETWLPDTTDQGDGDGDIDDQCPHDPRPR